MTSGVGRFIAGIEDLSYVQSICERYNFSPKTFVRAVAVVCAALLILLLAVLFIQNGKQAKETPEVSNSTILEAAPTTFNKEGEVPVTAQAESQAVQEVTVYVSGAVAAPGLYVLKSKQRVGDAIEAAGGVLPDAATAAVNYAEPLSDGMQVHMPRRDEVSIDAPGSLSANGSSSSAGGSVASTGSAALVNINTADSTTLQTLEGIGPATAQKIIEYRGTHGSFKSKEDIKNVSGIGEKKYAALEARITV